MSSKAVSEFNSTTCCAQHAFSAFACHAMTCWGWVQVLTEAGEQSSSKLSLSTLLDIMAPVLHQFVLEGKAAENSGHEIKQVAVVLE